MHPKSCCPIIIVPPRIHPWGKQWAGSKGRDGFSQLLYVRDLSYSLITSFLTSHVDLQLQTVFLSPHSTHLCHVLKLLV